MSDLTGVIPITATPFDAEGRLDEDSIVSLVEFEARCGVHGLNVLGIMGEFHHRVRAPARRRDLHQERGRPIPDRRRDVPRRDRRLHRAVAGGRGGRSRGDHGGAAAGPPR